MSMYNKKVYIRALMLQKIQYYVAPSFLKLGKFWTQLLPLQLMRITKKVVYKIYLNKKITNYKNSQYYTTPSILKLGKFYIYLFLLQFDECYNKIHFNKIVVLLYIILATLKFFTIMRNFARFSSWHTILGLSPVTIIYKLVATDDSWEVHKMYSQHENVREMKCV